MARLVFSNYPGIVAMATAPREPGDTASTTVGASKHAAMVLRGSELAQFLLSAAKPATGSFIYSHAAVDRAGLFSSEFEYCPDEEFVLRLAPLWDPWHSARIALYGAHMRANIDMVGCGTTSSTYICPRG